MVCSKERESREERGKTWKLVDGGIGGLLGGSQESRSYLTHARKIGYLKPARADLTSNKGILWRLRVVRVKRRELL